ncbi:Olfactory Receptor 3A2 [Manis pentadactyla]|nr:Olfactory Receptor 3A2 [Manis pentadactyla]
MTAAHSFAIFLFAYLLTVGGNLSILAAVLVEPKLHTLMYCFLGNLSMLDVGCITVTVPPMLVYLLAHQCRVPYTACISQLFVFHLLASVDCHFLTAMAYDHYLAICQPLTYSTRMSCEVQGALVGICCAISFINALTHTVAVSHPPQWAAAFCGGIFMGVLPMISVSYAYVAAAVLKICSAEGRRKASICGSHLTVVCIFYETGIFSCMRLGSVSASDKDKGIDILNTILSPMLNLLIYSLWNPDVQGVLWLVLMGRQAPE